MLTLQPFVMAPAEASSGWTVVGGAGFSNGAISFTSLAIDASGAVYVVYMDEGYGSKAIVMKYSGSDWVPVGNNASDAAATFISLAIDGTGTPCIAYKDWDKDAKITVKKYNGTDWETVGNPGFSGGEANDISLDIDSSGTPYVAYTDLDKGERATVMKYNGTDWVPVGSPGFSAGSADYISLALDGNGNPYLAYRDGNDDRKATVMKYNGTDWETVGSAGISAGQADHTSLALDSGGTPYVAYRDWGNDMKTTVLSYNGSDWFPIGSPAFSAGFAGWTSLALDGDGNPYLAFRDEYYDGKATVMRYLPDTTAPHLTAGGVSRNSDSEATVKFTSDEAGQYYYQVVAAGNAPPAIDSSGPGIACGTSEETISLAGLSAGGHDIYIIVKDEAGNVSDALRIAIPALLSGAPVLSANPGNSRVNLSWTPVEGSISYSVYQSTVSGVYGNALASVADTVYEYEVINLTNGTTYYFKVNAVDAYGTSTSSNEVEATPRGGTSSSESPAAHYVSSTTGSASVFPATGGRVGLNDDAAVEIPANALRGSAALTVKVERVENPPAVPSGFRIGSDIYSITVDGASSYSFGKPVTLTFKFNPADFPDGEIPAIYYYDELSAAWVKVGGTVSGSYISVTVDHFTKYAVMAEKATTEPSAQAPEAEHNTSFTDLDRHWAKKTVEKLAGLGVIGGYPDGSFRPDANITRAEFTAMLVKALSLQGTGSVRSFSDTVGHWAQSSIATAAALGIVGGYSDNSFKPDQPITREEMAVIATKSLKLAEVSGETGFVDNSLISSWAKGGVLAATNAKVMNGYPDNSFNPQGNTTRAEAATVILNIMNMSSDEF